MAGIGMAGIGMADVGKADIAHPESGATHVRSSRTGMVFVENVRRERAFSVVEI